MAHVKIEITLSTGEKSIIEKEISNGSLTFAKIEDLTTHLKREMLPDLEADLLRMSQQHRALDLCNVKVPRNS